MACFSTSIGTDLSVWSIMKALCDTDGLLWMIILSSDTDATILATWRQAAFETRHPREAQRKETPPRIQETFKRNSCYGLSGANIRHDYSHNLPTGVECMLIFTKRSSSSGTGGLIRLNPSKFPKPCESMPKQHYPPPPVCPQPTRFGAAQV